MYKILRCDTKQHIKYINTTRINTLRPESGDIECVGACPYGQGNHHQPGQNKTDHNSGNELWSVFRFYIEKRILNLVPMIIYRV